MASDAVQQIKDRLTIQDVVAPYVQLSPAGKNLKGRSPFTNERTPSFYVSPDRGVFYCFSSNRGGDIFTFIQDIEGVDFKGALKLLAEKAGVELVPEDPKKRSERDTLYLLMDAATTFYTECLERNSGAKAYLAERGIRPETITAWRIGYAPGPPSGGWRELYAHLTQAGHTEPALLKAGLVKGGGEGKQPYDVFRDRVVFPLYDASGRVVAFSGRILSKDVDAPKYVNSPETELYNKSELLYGYDRAKSGIRSLGFSMIVEGQFDVVMCHQAGFTNTVAVSGTALTPRHVSLLERLSTRVVLALDSDRAGIAALKKAAELMLVRGMDVKVATLADGADPADVLKSSPAVFKEAVKQATHVIPFLMDMLQRTAKDARAYGLSVREEVLPFVARIDNALDREHFINVVADRLEVPATAVRQEVERWQKRVAESTHTSSSTPMDEPSTVNSPAPSHTEDEKASLEDRSRSIAEYIAVTILSLPAPASKMWSELFAEVCEESPEKVQASLSPERQSQLTFEVEGTTLETSQIHRIEAVRYGLTQLIALRVRIKVSALRTALKQAETARDEQRAAGYLQEIATLQQKKSQFEAAVAKLAAEE